MYYPSGVVERGGDVLPPVSLGVNKMKALRAYVSN